MGDEQRRELARIATALVTPGKGILAADESLGSIAVRLGDVGVESSEANRTTYRELLFTANPKELDAYLGGMMFFEESLFQKTRTGKPFPQVVHEAGPVVGVKVDKGTVPLPGSEDEKMTQGLDGLDERCRRYYETGARFTKWRNILHISDHTPSATSIEHTAEALARYALISQRNGLVPIVEPEILMDGDHDLETSLQVTVKVLAAVINRLVEYGVYLEGCLLKPNMVCPGTDCPKTYTVEQSAQATVTALQRTVPPAMAGIVFLSGGLSEEDATLHLNAVNNVQGRKPWPLSFSYGRALQASTLKTWRGKEENFAAAQQVFLTRAKANSEATLGKYQGAHATDMASESLFVKDHQY